MQKYGSNVELIVVWKKVSQQKYFLSFLYTWLLFIGACCWEREFAVLVVVFFMNIVLLCIGATAKGFLEDGIAEYTKRLQRYTAFTIQVLPSVRNAQSLSAGELKQREGERIVAALQSTDSVVILDEKGREYTSREFAGFVQKERNAGRKRLVFVVGGVYGISPEVRLHAASNLRLSAMTLTHDMVRLLFVEQLYRACTILEGEKYHHD